MSFKQQQIDRQTEVNFDTKALNNRMDRIKQGKDYRLDNWNIDYEKHK